MFNTKQLTLKFYEDEKIPKTPKANYGDIAIVERQKFVGRDYIKFNVMVLLLTNKDYCKTSWNWRDKFHNNREMPIDTLEHFNRDVRWYNNYLDNNKSRYGKSTHPSVLQKAKKNNTSIGDEIIIITKARTTYNTYKTVYDGTMNLKGFFKIN